MYRPNLFSFFERIWSDPFLFFFSIRDEFLGQSFFLSEENDFFSGILYTFVLIFFLVPAPRLEPFFFGLAFLCALSLLWKWETGLFFPPPLCAVKSPPFFFNSVNKGKRQAPSMQTTFLGTILLPLSRPPLFFSREGSKAPSEKKGTCSPFPVWNDS